MSTENHKLLLEIPNTLQTPPSLNAPYLKTLNPELIIVYTHYTNLQLYTTLEAYQATKFNSIWTTQILLPALINRYISL